MIKTRNSSDRTSARATRVAASSLLALSALSVGVGSALAAGGSGSIWTTDADCDAAAAQHQNLYAVGQTVYVRAERFDASTPLSWSIEGMPGGASGDPGLIVASGSATTDGTGALCLDLYEIAPDDWGVYSVDVTQGRTSKNDNYRVDGAGDPGDQTTDPGDDATDPGDQTTDPGDDTTDPGDQTTDPGDDTTDPGDQTTDPGDDTTDPGDQTTDPGDDQTTDPGDDATDPGDQTTDPGDQTTDPSDDQTTDPGDQTTDPSDDQTTDPGDNTTDPADETSDGTAEVPASTVAGESSASGPADSTTGGTTPGQSVLGAVLTGGSLELPPTDTIAAAVTDSSSIFLVLGLAGLAAAAVLFTPIRRR
jgi:hypothetical protein